MGDQIQQNSVTYPLMVYLVNADGITPATGLTPTILLSKNGSNSWGAPAGAVTEVGNGYYKVAPNATDSNTLGPLKLIANSAGIPQQTSEFQIVGFNPNTVGGSVKQEFDTGSQAITPALGIYTTVAGLEIPITGNGNTLNLELLNLDGSTPLMIQLEYRTSAASNPRILVPGTSLVSFAQNTNQPPVVMGTPVGFVIPNLPPVYSILVYVLAASGTPAAQHVQARGSISA